MGVKVTSRIIKDLDKRLIEQLAKRIEGGHKTVNVGFPATGEMHRDEDGASDMSVAAIAAVHEFGTDTIPERSFLRAGIRKNKAGYVRLNILNLRKVVRGELTIDRALGRLAEQAKADVQMEITNGDFPALDPETIRRKGSSKPLIDSGQMRQSVAWEFGDD